MDPLDWGRAAALVSQHKNKQPQQQNLTNWTVCHSARYQLMTAAHQ